jgi:hypothetical protein
VTPFQFFEWCGLQVKDQHPALVFEEVNFTRGIHRVRQFTEAALALLFTVGLMRALKKTAGD